MMMLMINNDNDDKQLAYDHLLQDVMFLLWHVCRTVTKTLLWDAFGSCATLWK
jgi:hypothetical protein